MCGIAGYFGEKEIEKNREPLIFNSLKHRGPDKFGKCFYRVNQDSHVSFFFSRLSVIDLHDRAMQPMTFGELTIMMNGEIYNYKNLKRIIEEEYGSQEWFTTSDTEVALRYLSYYGINGLKDFDGMFSIALWDNKKLELTLARDFFGEKPLFYCVDINRVVFASEPKTIFQLHSLNRQMRRGKVANFIINGYKNLYSFNDNFWDGISQVPPGQAIVFKHNARENPEFHVYKCIPPEVVNKYESRESVIQRIRNSVIESVGRRLESDVPVALSLSGGIDSSLIAAIAKKEFGIALSAFTLSSQDDRYSEVSSAAKVANYLGLEHTVVEVLSGHFLQRMKEMIRFHDSPVSTISYYIQNLLMEEIHRKGFKVSLMGTGADEIFSGYYDHHLLYLAEIKYSYPDLYENAVESWKKNVLPHVRNPVFQSPTLYVNTPEYRDHIYDGAKTNRLLVKTEIIDEFQEREYSPNLMRNRMLNELFHEVIPVILKEDDRNSMMYSVENRSPYLSYEVLSESMKTETRHLIHNGRTKSLLRDAFAGYLPDEILGSYRKIGFNASFSEICDISGEEFKFFIEDDSEFWETVDRNKARDVFENSHTSDSLSKTAFNLVSAKMFVDEFTQNQKKSNVV